LIYRPALSARQFSAAVKDRRLKSQQSPRKVGLRRLGADLLVAPPTQVGFVWV
jgi:hypothetical protein